MHSKLQILLKKMAKIRKYGYAKLIISRQSLSIPYAGVNAWSLTLCAQEWTTQLNNDKIEKVWQNQIMYHINNDESSCLEISRCVAAVPHAVQEWTGAKGL